MIIASVDTRKQLETQLVEHIPALSDGNLSLIGSMIGFMLDAQADAAGLRHYRKQWEKLTAEKLEECCK